jgi:inosose dehydratase
MAETAQRAAARLSSPRRPSYSERNDTAGAARDSSESEVMISTKLAINPLPWVLTAKGFDLSLDTVTRALADLEPIGYRGFHADIPEGLTPAQYAVLLADHGFVPAPGYFAGSFQERESLPALLEAARRHAAGQAALGLEEVFIASNLTAERMAEPATGAGADPDRIEVIAESLIAASGAMAAEGVTPALHPHVGSLIETEDEIRSVLDLTAGSPLAFGPDVGHITWAGGNPAALIGDYRDRVSALHLKDVDASAVQAAQQAGAGYMDSTMSHHVWTEPGRGVVDFEGIFAALPAEFSGWMVVEVDVPNLPTPLESSRASYEYFERFPALRLEKTR